MSTQTRTKMPTAQGSQTGGTVTQPMPAMPMEARGAPHVPPEMVGRTGTETKSALKATEFYIYLIAVAGVLASAQLVGSDSVGGDVFRADLAWLYVTLLTIGYLVSRGLAKAGSSWRNARERSR